MGRAAAPTQPRSVTTAALHMDGQQQLSGHHHAGSHHTEAARTPAPRAHLPAFLVGVLALVLSIGAAGLALVAVGLASGANDRIGTLLTGPLAGDPARSSPAPTAENPAGTNPAGTNPAGTNPAGTNPASTNPAGTSRAYHDLAGGYTVRYTAEDLHLQTARCRTVAIDLDEPRVGADGATTDLAVTGECGHPPAFEVPAGVAAARVHAADTSPSTCAERIRRAPLSPDIPLPVRAGTVLCAATSPDAARAYGLSRKIVVLTVRAVSKDGLVSVRVAAWNAPA
jgi:hypothetical protein